MKLKEIQSNGMFPIRLLLENVAEREARNNKPYLLLDLSDGETKITAKIWDMDLQLFGCGKGDLLDCFLRVGSYNGAPDYTLQNWRKIPDADITGFVRTVPIQPEKIFYDIIELVNNHISDKYLHDLVSNILNDNKEKLLVWSAAKNIHHNLRGGLIYHMYRMAQTGILLTKNISDDIFTPYLDENINGELVLAGALLHDIGKLEELDSDVLGNAEYTVAGNLLGHIYLGCRIIESYAQKLHMPEEMKKELLHIIASHHGEPEFGAIARPATVEAYIVSQLDMMDSRIYIFENALSGLEKGNMTVNRVFGLNSYVYRPDRVEPSQKTYSIEDGDMPWK